MKESSLSGNKFADTEKIEGEFAEAERSLLRLDPTGENLNATQVYQALEHFRDELLSLINCKPIRDEDIIEMVEKRISLPSYAWEVVKLDLQKAEGGEG